MNGVVKGMILVLMILYIVSPVDACPGPIVDLAKDFLVGGTFVTHLAARHNIHMKYGIIGSSDMDLSPLSKLNGIKFINYFFNQKATSLWDMSGNKSLIGLSI
ncbi:MAG: hypothetical protein K5644_04605 [Lachnospiraceae bacterium]|nr:hypothetical protein [Lachnospiraceae bacterium]